MLKTVNYSMTNPNFVNSIIDIFHSRLPTVLKQDNLWRVTLQFPILPVCEQPMNPTNPIPKCFKSRCKILQKSISFLDSVLCKILYFLDKGKQGPWQGRGKILTKVAKIQYATMIYQIQLNINLDIHRRFSCRCCVSLNSRSPKGIRESKKD